MKINRLRLLGFKSFVDPTELAIEPGLTGVVGPNGCGKSNLLEALRWVMGETSHKSMRAAAMDDVIFSGTNQRPARNMAEVTIFLDNSARSAPAQFNDTEVIEITRRIERDAGSAYRINGADVRARDVKILFEDAATGARSPALVRQGQIGEIVNAKPEQRRRILEDAAGVAGLHSRRHDAELRLKAAEGNLARLADIMGSLTSQIESLKRQARQARRYKEISGEIRKAEAIAAYVGWSEANAQVEAEEVALREALVQLGAAVEAESAAQRLDTELADSLQPLREEEATRGAILARLKIEQTNFEREAERAIARRNELADRIAQLADDLAREESAIGEAADVVARIDGELMELAEADESAGDAGEAGQVALDAARKTEAEAASRLSDLTRRDFEQQARRKSLESALAERREQSGKIQRQLAALDCQLRELSARAPDPARLAEQQETSAEFAQAIEDGEIAILEAEEALAPAVAEARATREQSQQASLDLRGVDAEQTTLARILRPRSPDGITPVLDRIQVARGYEAAFGAALGDELDAPLAADTAPGDGDTTGSPIEWRLLETQPGDTPLPAGAEPLLAKVEAPPELHRRLAQTGVVDPADGPRLQLLLAPGQRLVTRRGDLWRWDGYVAGADAPTAAAERLSQRNRLTEIEHRQVELRDAAAAADTADRQAQARVATSEEAARRARQGVREAQQQLARTREGLAALERAARDAESRLAGVRDAREQAGESLAEALEKVADVEAMIEAAADDAGVEDELAAAEAAREDARACVMRLAAEAAAFEREHKLRADRLVALRSDRQRWATRSDGARRQIAALKTRADEARSELVSLDALPAEIDAQRQRLVNEIADTERQRAAAADRLAAAETALRQSQQTLRTAQAEVATAREARVRVEARLEGNRERRAEEARRTRETLACEPEGCLAIAEFPAGATLPRPDEIERQLSRLRTDRERLGGVNLAADQELETINAQFDSMEKERLDVEEAIAKLRGAIGQLNREGKKRIDEAFQAVNAHFQSLFTTLFGGGEARLEMIEGEDPLEGGLEIIAKPPGKKPATLSLLSGGEQTLTALSLIFAVFLTNPSPICVLDEVDAPLDDANVDRFSTLMEKMAAETDTRFLVITHHPMTMSRMDRLFGVTMGERGVSQLVSVDLATAEQIVVDDPLRATG